MNQTQSLILKAPLSGVVVPLDQVPDPVFAQRMVGDGVSIDPVTARLVAPCDGRVLHLHPSAHAVTIAPIDGVEVLIHVGLDTVQLKGRGFAARVKAGDQVHMGDALIDFEPDYVATHARSLLTQIVVTHAGRVASMRAAAGFVTAAADTLLHVTLAEGGSAATRAAAPPLTSPPLTITNASGIHARPAAVLASRARQFDADVTLRHGERQANARSVVGLMALEIAAGDRVQIVASGPQADAALRELSQLILDGLGEGAGAPAVGAARDARPAQPPARTRSTDANLLEGVAASPGLAVGTVVQVRHQALSVPETGGDARRERQLLDAALEHAKADLDALQARLRRENAGDKAAIFAAHRELLDDPDLLDMASDAIAQGKSAGFGWQIAFTRQAERLSVLANELLAARANDLRDVGRRVLQKLAGVDAAPISHAADAILIAEELTPSDTASLDRDRVLGLCTTTGGASSHVAILARSLDIPLIAGADPAVLDLADGTPVILDGSKGSLRINPSADEIARIRLMQESQSRDRAEAQRRAQEPATTLDGHRMEVAANISGLADAEQSLALGGEGVGLLRTEFLFLNRATAPTEEEQYEVYRSLARALGPERRLVVRTLDVGGDKPVPYIPLPHEDNPFLGERGVRVMLNRPELLRAQLRAVLRATRDGRLAVMFPMIATLDEWRAVRIMLDEEGRNLGVAKIEAGIMIEVPSAALLADRFAPEVDFFSIGTNDLTQYVLAMDRGHPRLAPQVDGLSPAVLRLIDHTVRAAKAHGRRTAVCGGIGGDPQAVPLLAGIGVDELSVSVPAIPAVKAQIRRLRLVQCQELARAALACATAAEVRALVPLEQPS